MKKIFFLFLLMLTITQCSFSQITWSPSGATWHYIINWFADQGYAEIKYDSNTVFAGKSCKKLIEHQRYRSVMGGAEINNFKDLYTYDSCNIIFMYNLIQGSNNWDTLFNFNTKPGGSWFSNSQDTFQVHVIDTGSNIINGFVLKWMNVTYPVFGGMYSDTIDNRIGAVGSFYPFDPMSSVFSDPLISGFCNYSDSSFAIFGNPDSTCLQIPNGINEINETENSIAIYPNPASDELIIDSKLLKINTIELTDVAGKLLMHLNPNNSITNFNISSFANGIYFIKMQMPEGDFIYKKIMKQ